jgi:hypothetical protein
MCVRESRRRRRSIRSRLGLLHSAPLRRAPCFESRSRRPPPPPWTSSAPPIPRWDSLNPSRRAAFAAPDLFCTRVGWNAGFDQDTAVVMDFLLGIRDFDAGLGREAVRSVLRGFISSVFLLRWGHWFCLRRSRNVFLRLIYFCWLAAP